MKRRGKIRGLDISTHNLNGKLLFFPIIFFVIVFGENMMDFAHRNGYIHMHIYIKSQVWQFKDCFLISHLVLIKASLNNMNLHEGHKKCLIIHLMTFHVRFGPL